MGLEYEPQWVNYIIPQADVYNHHLAIKFFHLLDRGEKTVYDICISSNSTHVMHRQEGGPSVYYRL